jgi:hypothetical protein
MITVLSEINKVPRITHGVENVLLLYIQSYGHIESLDRWANELDLDPKWVRICAHGAAKKGLIILERQNNKCGKPYRVTANKEEV